jgi:putative ABC transport system permease protein
LFLSGFLVVNTITAILAQQVRQIGIMKAIGARRRQIVAMYLGMVLLYGGLALLIAVPSASWLAGELSNYLAGFINVDFPDYTLPLNVLLLESALGLLVPLIAAIFPIWSGTRVTVREALCDYGITPRAMRTPNRLARLTNRISAVSQMLSVVSQRWLSRPLRLSLRNTFRRTSRLVLTLMTLILGGTIFIAVLSVHASVNQTLEDVFKS